MKRLIVLVAVGFFIGKLAVSALQSLSHTPTARTGNFNFEKGLDDYKRLPPIPDADPKMPPLDPAAFAYKSGAKLTPQPTGFNVGGVQVAKTEPAKKVEDKKKDDKQGDKKKDQESEDEKRKKKLEDVADQNQVPTVPVPQALPPPVAPQQQNPGFGGPIVAPPPQTETPATPPSYYGAGGGGNTNPVNILGYIDALVHRPTAALMQAFVALWQKKQITAAQYYEVLDDMQKSSVLLSRQFAIQAAAMQRSYQDFQILADEAQTEPDPTTKTQANTDVQAYNVSGDVSILNEGLASADSSAKTVAAGFLAPIISGYFSSKNTQGAESLQILLPTLAQLEQTAGPLQTQAQTMYSELAQLLGIPA